MEEKKRSIKKTSAFFWIFWVTSWFIQAKFPCRKNRVRSVSRLVFSRIKGSWSPDPRLWHRASLHQWYPQRPALVLTSLVEGETVPTRYTTWYHMDVSKNNGTPKSSILIGFSIINHPCWGTSIFGNTHIVRISNSTLIQSRERTHSPPVELTKLIF